MSAIHCFRTLAAIRERKPLVHHITNWVTISECANITLNTGALPVMAHAEEETPDMVNLASALVLNIGTLTPGIIEAMIAAGKRANERGIPVVLDAVGAGATPLRTGSTRKLLETLEIDVLKGNAGEIAVLAGAEAEVRGVESISVTGGIGTLAGELATAAGATVAATGEVDTVADRKGQYRVKNGHSLMGEVVGTGCMAASVIGAFVSVENDHALAAARALSAYGIAGEIAAEKANGPGTFKMHFFDAVRNLDEETLEKREIVDYEKR